LAALPLADLFVADFFFAAAFFTGFFLAGLGARALADGFPRGGSGPNDDVSPPLAADIQKRSSGAFSSGPAM